VNQAVAAEDSVGCSAVDGGKRAFREIDLNEGPVRRRIPCSVGRDDCFDDVAADICDDAGRCQVDVRHPVKVAARNVDQPPNAKLMEQTRETGANAGGGRQTRTVAGTRLLAGPQIGFVHPREPSGQVETRELGGALGESALCDGPWTIGPRGGVWELGHSENVKWISQPNSSEVECPQHWGQARIAVNWVCAQPSRSNSNLTPMPCVIFV